MAIYSRSAPQDATDIVARELQAISQARGRGDFNAVDSDSGGAQVPRGAGLPIYGLPLDRLAGDPEAVLSRASQTGWRFLVSDARGYKLVDVLDGVADEEPTAVVVKGQLVERFCRAGELAEEFGAEASMEARVLDFGRLGMSELWLHSEDGEDIFYSLGSATPERRGVGGVLEEANIRDQRQSKRADRGGTQHSEQDDGDSGG